MGFRVAFSHASLIVMTRSYRKSKLVPFSTTAVQSDSEQNESVLSSQLSDHKTLDLSSYINLAMAA